MITLSELIPIRSGSTGRPAAGDAGRTAATLDLALADAALAAAAPLPSLVAVCRAGLGDDMATAPFDAAGWRHALAALFRNLVATPTEGRGAFASAIRQMGNAAWTTAAQQYVANPADASEAAHVAHICFVLSDAPTSERFALVGAPRRSALPDEAIELSLVLAAVRARGAPVESPKVAAKAARRLE